MSKKGQKVHNKKVFIPYMQNQLTLPMTVDSLIPENHVVRVVSRAIDQMNLEPLLAKYPGGGRSGEIAERFNMTKPSISHHLSQLKQAGLVTDERQGQNILYSLNTTVFQDVMGWFVEMAAGKRPGEGEKND